MVAVVIGSWEASSYSVMKMDYGLEAAGIKIALRQPLLQARKLDLSTHEIVTSKHDDLSIASSTVAEIGTFFQRLHFSFRLILILPNSLSKSVKRT